MATIPTYDPASTPLDPSDQFYLEQGSSADRGKRATVQMIMDKVPEALGDLSSILPCRAFTQSVGNLTGSAVQTGSGSDSSAVSASMKLAKLGYRSYGLAVSMNMGSQSSGSSSLGACTWRFVPQSTDTLALEFVASLPTSIGAADLFDHSFLPVLGSSNGLVVYKPASPLYGPTEFYVGNAATWQPSTVLGFLVASGIVLTP